MINLERGTLANGLDHEGLKCTKKKMKTKKKATAKPPEGDFLKRAEILQEQKANVDQTNERLISSYTKSFPTRH
ncbi:hypothetical protein OIU85_014531 [Salix viminalis]|uniref:Uncharacterized protein n=1 Tax=Salix viminalis TaxID=40686 RepID=A0A9Q0NJB8_SALVM|nr:hypothetical protein OIU85_014531 [Salix viminalis]